MNQPPKDISLAEIHSAYASKPLDKKKTPTGEKTKTYAKSSHYDRDPSHTGEAPAKPDVKRPGSRK
ncbi:hypothetical protein [Dyella sp. 2RAB6]|uniref:hypothetical protein n=1 Tax=Dyella sp. 2RAB6 TaxID=3232992 RepID=UPI003F9109B6